MTKKTQPIGVIDSGIGGLTVVRELQKLLPEEDIIYFGDSVNCPYGNKSKDQIFDLTKNMLCFMKNEDVKIVAIACNTISTLINDLTPIFDYKIVGIIDPVVSYVANMNCEKIGLIATEFTVKSHYYDKMIHNYNPSIEVISRGSHSLARLIDQGDFSGMSINREISTQIDHLLMQSNLKSVILGCTHYPIVEENFKYCFPNINFINPAYEQAKAIKDYLMTNNLLSKKRQGKFTIFTSGDPYIYETVSKKLDLAKPNILLV